LDPKLACAVTLALVFLCGARRPLPWNLGVHTAPPTGVRLPLPQVLYFDRLQKN